MLGYITKEEKKLLWINIFNVIVGAVEMYIGLYMSKWIFDGVGIKEKNRFIMELCIVVVGLFIISVVRIFFIHIIQPFSSYNIQKCIVGDLIKKIIYIPKKMTDDTDYFDKITRAMGDSKTRPEAVLGTVFAFVSAIVQGGLMIMITVRVDLQIALVIFAASVCTSVLLFFSNRVNFKQYMEETMPVRKSEYTTRVIYLPQFCVDLKSYSDFLVVLLKHFYDSLRELKKIIKKYRKIKVLLECLMVAISLISTNLFPWIVVVNRLYDRSITNGTAVLLLSAAGILPGIFSGILSSIVELGKHSLYIDNIREILNNNDLQNNCKEKKMERIELLELRDVSFSYDNNIDSVLFNVNLKIKRGEKIGIVGDNGTGKTTFCMLLNGIYEPCDGKVLINGVPLSEYTNSSIHEKIVSVNQLFNIYSYSVIENIVMREVKADDYEKVEDILKLVGLHERIMSTKNKLDSMITKEFDGEGLCLSGGELQKIAMARIFAAKPEVIILDEATCHLDIEAEKKILNNLFQKFYDKTIIIISHRMDLENNVERIIRFTQDGILG